MSATPSGFNPPVTEDLQLAFSEKAAVDGVDIPRADTISPPTVGTSAQLSGSYTLLMIDTDTPPQMPGGQTGTFLHWIQPGLTSSSEPNAVAGQQLFTLSSPDNVTAIASYVQPSPPNKAPVSHKYTTLLLNTTENDAGLSILARAAQNRGGFNTTDTLSQAGIQLTAGGFFNVTNEGALALGPLPSPDPVDQSAEIQDQGQGQASSRTSVIFQMAPTILPVGGEKNTGRNTTIQVPQAQETIIIINIGGGGNGAAPATTIRSITSFTTPVVQATGSGGAQVPSLATGAPFSNVTAGGATSIEAAQPAAGTATTSGLAVPANGASGCQCSGSAFAGVAALVAALLMV